MAYHDWKSHSVGTPGIAWGGSERAQWRSQVSVQRSYLDEVVNRLESMKNVFDVEQYGALSDDPEKYPLYCVKTRNWGDETKPFVLITGGSTCSKGLKELLSCRSCSAPHTAHSSCSGCLSVYQHSSYCGLAQLSYPCGGHTAASMLSSIVPVL